MTRIEWATATAAFARPRRAASRRYCAARYVPFARPAACAAWTRHARSQGLPFARLAAATLACALVVAGAQPGPGGQMLGAPEAAHVGADLGHQRLGHGPANAGNRVQPRDRVFNGSHPLGDLGAYPSEGLVEEIDVRQLLGDQKTLVGLETPGQGLLQLRELLP